MFGAINSMDAANNCGASQDPHQRGLPAPDAGASRPTANDAAAHAALLDANLARVRGERLGPQIQNYSRKWPLEANGEVRIPVD